MKIRYMAFGLLALMVAGCSNEELAEDRLVTCPVDGEVQIAATIAGGDDTRVAFTPGGSTTYADWEQRDTITLYTDEQANLHYVAGANEYGEVAFSATGQTLTNTEGTHVYACYPMATSTDRTQVALPDISVLDFNSEVYVDEATGTESTIVKSRYCPFLYARGTVQESKVDLHFHHLYAYLRLIVKADVLGDATDKTIHAISLNVAGDLPLSTVSGVFNLEDQTPTYYHVSQDQKIYRTHDFVTGDLELYIPVLPIEASSLMTIKLLHSLETETTLYTMEKNLPATGFLAGNVYTLTLTKQEPAEVAYLTDGLTFNGRIKQLANDTTAMAVNGTDNAIVKIEFKTEVNDLPEKYVVVSADDSETPIYASFNAADGRLTVSTAAKSMEIVDASYLCHNLTALQSVDWGGFSINKTTTNMKNMFFICLNLLSLDVSGWDTSNVTDMSYMFSNCSLATLDLSGWDTSNVTNMRRMFIDCRSLATLDVSGWNTSKVTDMHYMFYACLNLLSLDVSGWDTSNVTDMNNMFCGCSALTSLDVSSWDTSNVTDMNDMFDSCSSLATLDVSGWNTSNVTNMGGMFFDCSSLATLDVSGWDTSNVTYMFGMFYGCSALTSLNVSNWNTSNVTRMNSMFVGCSL